MSLLLRPSRPTIREISTTILQPFTTTPKNTSRLHPKPTPRTLHTSPALHSPPPKPKRINQTSNPLPKKAYNKDRGPPSSEKTQTDFNELNIFNNTPTPSTSIDECVWDGFHLGSGLKITGGQGAMLVGGEAFAWCPWLAGGGDGKRLLNGKGQWEVGDDSWGVLSLVWPKPDLLILGLGPSMAPLSPKTRAYISSLGIRVDVQDTRNGSAQFNLLATERGVGSVAAALVPIGFREGVGIKA